MDEKLLKSAEIVQQTVDKFKPKAIFMMFSGGNDSRCAYAAAKVLKVPLTHFIHGNTRTGIRQTTEYARTIGAGSGLPYVEADAGDAYERYVLRKGFFGLGVQAHSFAYHVIKADHFRREASRLRQGRRNYKILFINGARESESENRSRNLTKAYNVDPSAKSNIWVNIIHHWTKKDCLEFLEDSDVPPNPVTQLLCRSGECMCGTMQSIEDRDEAAYWFPEWGQWVDDIRQRVLAAGFEWDWGQSMPGYVKERNNGQLEFAQMADYTPEFMPACVSCKLKRGASM